MNPYISAPKNLLYFSLLSPCLHMHRPQDREAAEVSAAAFFAARKLSNRLLTRVFISASDTSGR